MSELFALPEALPLLLLAPLLWIGMRAIDRLRSRRLAAIVGPRAAKLSASLDRSQRRNRRALTGAGLLLAFVAVMQPRWGVDLRRAELRGIDLVVCLDVSRSMLAQDLRPNRLRRAQQEIRALAGRSTGDRMGLVAFAGQARLLAPLTRDMTSFSEIVDLANPTSVDLGGTDLGVALETALSALNQDSDHRSVLLITDGEDLEQRGLAVAELCRQQNVTVHCMGIGSQLGSKIPLQDDGGEVFLRTRTGEEVVSTMDAPGLRRIAELTGGGFIDAGTSPNPLIDLYDEHILPMAVEAFESDTRRERKNRFQWPLLVAFLLWIVELSRTDRVKR